MQAVAAELAGNELVASVRRPPMRRANHFPERGPEAQGFNLVETLG